MLMVGYRKKIFNYNQDLETLVIIFCHLFNALSSQILLLSIEYFPHQNIYVVWLVA
jgi:hypothetical protein